MINNEIREYLQKVCASMNKQGVEYMLIGGAAVGFYGYQRISGGGGFGPEQMKHDLDFWYNPTLTNFERLINALGSLGVDRKRLDQIVFNPTNTYLRIPQPTFKMEFLPVMKGLKSFNDSMSRCREIELDGNKISIIGYQDLILNKKAVGREIDKSDIIELTRINKDQGKSTDM